MNTALIVATVLAQFIVLLATSPALEDPTTADTLRAIVLVCVFAAPVMAYIAGSL